MYDTMGRTTVLTELHATKVPVSKQDDQTSTLESGTKWRCANLTIRLFELHCIWGVHTYIICHILQRVFYEVFTW
jgi:hypothetical protein